MSHAKREPKSPYARYGKRPYRYSEIYTAWQNADNQADRQHQADRHNMAFLGFIPRRYQTAAGAAYYPSTKGASA